MTNLYRWIYIYICFNFIISKCISELPIAFTEKIVCICTLLNLFYKLPNFFLRNFFGGRCYYPLHFMDEEIQTERTSVIGLTSQREWALQMRLRSNLTKDKAISLVHWCKQIGNFCSQWVLNLGEALKNTEETAKYSHIIQHSTQLMTIVKMTSLVEDAMEDS